MLLLVLLLGLIFGSFVSAFSYRYPRGISISEGRSFCDHCKKTIHWYDNIPLLSYLLLLGKCRFCKKPISPRNPIIELTTGLVFVLIYKFSGIDICQSTPLYLCSFTFTNVLLFIVLLFTSIVLVSAAAIDFENYIIPDELFFALMPLAFVWALSNQQVYSMFFSGFFVSLILLSLNLITRGRGMGLGDVKLVLPLGMFFVFYKGVVFLMISFVIGALVGIILIASGKRKFGSKVPFGPFLIISFFVNILMGDKISYLFGFLLS